MESFQFLKYSEFCQNRNKNILKISFYPHEEKSFIGWMRETNNMFTGDEYHFRFGIWMSNKRRIQEHNRANLGFTLALNKFAHMTKSEYESLLGTTMPNSFGKNGKKAEKINSDIPEHVDWREKNVVNPIQNQGACGSCWAFSAIQAQESAYAIKTQVLQKLSEQFCVDCVDASHGCNGGWMDYVYDWVTYNTHGKCMLLSDYPYKGVQGSCIYDKTKLTSHLEGYYNVPRQNETALAEYIANYGPAAIAVNASPYTFTYYSGGVYTDSACIATMLNHGVGCVGFGKEGDKKYWIVRNSSGPEWGEKGYIRIGRDMGNLCGVSSAAFVPYA